MRIALSLIRESSQKVRSSWDEEALNELRDSIKEQGVIVPVKVRPEEGLAECKYHGLAWLDGDGVPIVHDSEPCFLCTELRGERLVEDEENEPWDWAFDPAFRPFELVYGHRRTEAARRAGLTEIEAIVEGMEDTDSLIQAIIEAIQHEDLSVLDKARAINRLMKTMQWNARDVERHGIMNHANVSELLAYLEEYDRGNVPVEDILQQLGRTDQGWRKILEVRHSLGNDDAGKKTVLAKAFEEGLTGKETRRVADAYRDAKTPEMREAVLKVRGDNPAFERAVEVQAGVDWGEELKERKVQRKLQENDGAVAQFFDSIKAFVTAIEATMAAVDFGRFSPEGSRFAIRRIDSLIEKLQELKEQLNVK